MNPTPLILIIDDDPDILKVLKANLELHKFSVITADSWSEGQKALSIGRPDLLILDLILPDGDGIEICRTLRRKYPLLPILMLTAKDSVSDKVIGLESGADDYMVKPFETMELIARIKACLRRTKPEKREEIIQIGELIIDLKKREVEKRGQIIELTPKQFNLLVFLAENRDRVISRKEIKEHLWQEKSLYSWSRVIDVHIMHLRQKIEDNPQEPEYILTMPGIGYRFKG